LWIAIFANALSLLLLPFGLKDKEPLSHRAILYSAGYGLFNRVASYLTLLTLAVLPASVQYPFITGGVMVVSTIISALIGQKPSKRELVSVALATLAVLLLVFLP
jgi:multidrug transporter EmrE-like cation transporter